MRRWSRAAWASPASPASARCAIDSERGILSAGPVTLRRGDIMTIDGTSGKVMRGAIEMRQPELSGEFGTIMQWADKLRRLRVRANAETPADAEAARRFGAEGIGLCRTEHMFFDADAYRGNARNDPRRRRERTPRRARQIAADFSAAISRACSRSCRAFR